MINVMLTRTRRITAPLLALALLAALFVALAAQARGQSTHAPRVAAGTARSTAAAASASPSAHAASSFLTGIGDEQTEMFFNPLWEQLHTKISRYIAPYDTAYSAVDLAKAKLWIQAAEARHQQILVAFYHSERTPTKMPSVALYERDVKKFMKDFPKVTQYQPWNEANRGNVKGMFASPTAVASAKYYQVLKRACHSCTTVGLDVLDQENDYPTLVYIAEFKREIGRLRTVMPSVWGLHNYSDTNRFQTSRTHAIVADLPGQVWLTETGGLVQFGSAFPNKNGAGLKRANQALAFMFKLAHTYSRITRLYIYDWSGGTSSTRFDAGLMDADYRPRQGYVTVCKELRAADCNVTVSKH